MVFDIIVFVMNKAMQISFVLTYYCIIGVASNMFNTK